MVANEHCVYVPHPFLGYIFQFLCVCLSIKKSVEIQFQGHGVEITFQRRIETIADSLAALSHSVVFCFDENERIFLPGSHSDRFICMTSSHSIFFLIFNGH